MRVWDTLLDCLEVFPYDKSKKIGSPNTVRPPLTDSSWYKRSKSQSRRLESGLAWIAVRECVANWHYDHSLRSRRTDDLYTGRCGLCVYLSAGLWTVVPRVYNTGLYSWLYLCSRLMLRWRVWRRGLLLALLLWRRRRRRRLYRLELLEVVLGAVCFSLHRPAFVVRWLQLRVDWLEWVSGMVWYGRPIVEFKV